MKRLQVKYAVLVSDTEWFAGFQWQAGSGDHVVTKDAGSAKLLDEEQVLETLKDLGKCGIVGTVYEVHLRAIGNARFT